MKKKNIIILGIIISFLIMFTIISLIDMYNSKNDKYEKLYQKFIDNEYYLNDYNLDNNMITNISYGYFDIDDDNKEELIVVIKDDTEFETSLFYQINKNKVKFIDKVYHYGELKYNRKDSAIVYTLTRPSMNYGFVIEYHKYDNNKFINIKNLIVEIDNDNYKYYIEEDNTKKEISESIYQEYINDNVSFSFKNITK